MLSVFSNSIFYIYQGCESSSFQLISSFWKLFESKFQPFRLCSAYLWHFTLISRCFSSFFACGLSHLWFILQYWKELKCTMHGIAFYVKWAIFWKNYNFYKILPNFEVSLFRGHSLRKKACKNHWKDCVHEKNGHGCVQYFIIWEHSFRSKEI